MVETREIQLEVKGYCDIVDITADLHEAIRQSGITSGTITAFCPGSTGGITTIEYEPGLLKDLPEFFEKLLPSDHTYHHDETWHDGNGFSHMRSALIGPSLTVPFVGGKLTLGTWQQVVFLHFDNKDRQRSLVLQMIGE
ncbi:MAG: secondary thiamine-phosphate synthase enzyme YjbQ [candidate division Zixibacteria bacterium]|nr:secondary thiamine-phosphate synthase enzyme YjbQ [candidate division Zixibacteria bacterium]